MVSSHTEGDHHMSVTQFNTAWVVDQVVTMMEFFSFFKVIHIPIKEIHGSSFKTQRE